MAIKIKYFLAQLFEATVTVAFSLQQFTPALPACVNLQNCTSTVKLSVTKLGTLLPLVLGGISENQFSVFVMPSSLLSFIA
jgi:hypothetical protein